MTINIKLSIIFLLLLNSSFLVSCGGGGGDTAANVASEDGGNRAGNDSGNDSGNNSSDNPDAISDTTPDTTPGNTDPSDKQKPDIGDAPSTTPERTFHISLENITIASGDYPEGVRATVEGVANTELKYQAETSAK